MSNANITAKTAPLPPWTNVRFTCARCTGEFQLCATDDCDEIDGTPNAFLTPHCPTAGCDHRSIITVAGVDDEPIGNAS